MRQPTTKTAGQLRIPFGENPWVRLKDCDPDGRRLYDRHYSRYIYRDGRTPIKFIGPGEYIALITPALDALFAWRKFLDDADDGSGKRQEGVNCCIFRNEGPVRSSLLILAAELFAWDRWPGNRLYTYVNGQATRSRRSQKSAPGQCFIMVGWRPAGQTRGGLEILEKRPGWEPPC